MASYGRGSFDQSSSYQGGGSSGGNIYVMQVLFVL